MRLMRVGAPGNERPVAATEHGWVDISSITPDIDGPFLAGDGLGRVRAEIAADRLPHLDVAGQRIGAPVARPGAVLCIGMNYAAHAAESGAQPPTSPVLFYKSPNTVIGPDDTVLIPRGSTHTDWEVELGVVIGRRARYLDTIDDALAHVAGYTIANDVSERDYQLEQSGGQWSKGKSCETFNPVGPWLVTPDEIPDPQGLRLRSWVNNEPRQHSTTADMIFGVAHLIWYLSQYLVLEPGDLINTGTPAGVAMSGRYPYLRPGDVMRLEIDGLGSQSQALKAAD
jgi:2-keto-4-pentenoate hydratase/2-oxohepta-3-ene-1,7-dioic acid hydratase in catechol pathway